MTAEHQDHEKLWDFMDDAPIAMFTTRDGHVLRSRPMYAKPDRDQGLIVFFVNAQDHKTNEIIAMSDVNVSFANHDDHVYVSCSGEAEIVSDPGTIDKYWSAAAEPWYAQGKDDPNLRLLRIKVSQAEYWERDANAIQMVWEMAKGAMSSDTPDIGENKKLNVA